MPEIKEVIRRLYMSRREFEERFPEINIHPASVIARIMVEEVYRPARPGEGVHAVLIEAGSEDQPWGDRPRQHLVLRGTRFASGRWLSQTPQPQQATDAEQEAPAV